MKTVLALFFILTFTTTVIPQNSREFNRELWKKEAQELDYVELETPEEIEKEERFTERQIQSSENTNFSSGAMNIILYIIVGLILVGLIVFLIIQYKEDPEIKNQKIIIEEDLDIETTQKRELEIKVEKALELENYRLAVRIYFLIIIKSLSVRELINWQKRKTNYIYLKEIGDNQLKTQFATTIKLFEIVWYGRVQISEDEYKGIEPVFKDLIRAIESGR